MFLGLIIEIIKENSLVGANAIPHLICQAGLVYYLIKRKLDSRLVYLLFSMVAAFFLFRAFTGVNPNLVLLASSRNHISSIMIFYTVFVYMTLSIPENKYPLLPVTILNILSLWAIGRSGIIASAVLLLGILIFRKISIYYWLTILTMVVSVYIIVEYDFLSKVNVFEKSFTLVKFRNNQILDDIRFVLMKEYIASINNPISIMFGNEYDYLRGMSNSNVHNSFITIHSRLGILGVLIIVYAIYKVIRYLIKMEVYGLLLLVILIRSFSDTILMPNQPFDFIFYYLLIKDL